MSALLEIEDLAVDYGDDVRALDGATLRVGPGEVVGVVGESGSGKSTLGWAVGRLLPRSASYARGRLAVAGTDVLGLDPHGLRALRREALAYVPQDPVGTLDPTLRVGRQLELAQRARGERIDAVAALEQVRLADPERTLRLFPHELSGGMAQRVVIAMAMARRPKLLVADEPTAALDAQVRETVTDVMLGLAAEHGTSVVWLSHDLRAVGRRCGRIAVMYGGRVVEDAPAASVLDAPVHPYTAALVASLSRGPHERLAPPPGSAAVLAGAATGCAFAPRCERASERCERERPTSEAGVLCHHPLDREPA